MQNLHMTLTFLGDVAPLRLETLSSLLDQSLLEDIPPAFVKIPLNDAGYWPDSEIIWLGSARDDEGGEVFSLVHRLRGLANRAGIRVSKRPFKPHVTLARRVSMPPPAPLALPMLLLKAQSLELYRSHLGPDGPRYEELASWALVSSVH